MEVHELTKKPIALHIMDDWPTVINKPGFLYHYWKKVIDRDFRQLLSRTSIFLSICDSMSQEYYLRYNKKFIPFHNPVEIRNWLPYLKKDYSIKDNFTILYAGRIGKGIKKSIKDISTSINILSKTYTNIIFEIQTNDHAELRKFIEFNEHIKWVKPINYSELPKKFSNVDLLIIPEDFDQASINFLKFSIQTKVAEFMISGTPTLVYADKNTALAKYATQENWAFVVSENKQHVLTEAIKTLYLDSVLRKDIAMKAQKIAVKNENADVVRENFRKCFIQN